MNHQAENIIKKTLGEPNSALSSKTSWRYGKKGSLSISLDQDKRGLWHNFETGEKGNLFQLLQKNTGLSKRDLYKYCARKLGLASSIIPRVAAVKAKPAKAKTVNEDSSLTNEQRKRVAFANKLVKQSLDVRGTLAERYLKEHRGIKKDIPKSFRYHPNLFSKINNQACPALLVIAKSPKGEIQAVQAIYLDRRTANKADVNVQKQTFGLVKNALVDIYQPNSPTGFVLVAEGPETGLSLREAIVDMNIKVSLSISNFSSIASNIKEKNVVLCLDNDGTNTATDKLIEHSSKILKDEDKSVWLNKPKEINKDYNDILKEQGRKAVYDYIQNSFQYRENDQVRINLKDYLHNINLTINKKTERIDIDCTSNKFRQNNTNLIKQTDVSKSIFIVKNLDEI
jgi:hypothetical protein